MVFIDILGHGVWLARGDHCKPRLVDRDLAGDQLFGVRY